MDEVEAIAARIRELPPQDFANVREWFHEYESECRGRGIASDFKAGKFNKLIEKARTERRKGCKN
jgi:hypothetical protein